MCKHNNERSLVLLDSKICRCNNGITQILLIPITSVFNKCQDISSEICNLPRLTANINNNHITRPCIEYNFIQNICTVLL